ncbi:MAG: hypothetical protein JWO05_2341 [Gemmatimonadetes bacterium]|nr:hypothetical protein [Gemmatimonadota bacterium]
MDAGTTRRGGARSTLMRWAAHFIIGEQVTLPAALLERWPELGRVRWRRGGLPPRVAGWCLGQPTVSAVTLWSNVYLGHAAPLDEELLLHEFRHVDQFVSDPLFAVRYIVESIRRGYHQNRFEVDARDYAAARLRSGRASP